MTAPCLLIGGPANGRIFDDSAAHQIWFPTDDGCAIIYKVKIFAFDGLAYLLAFCDEPLPRNELIIKAINDSGHNPFRVLAVKGEP
jgi:hypothetical protein